MKRTLANSKPQSASSTSFAGKPVQEILYLSVWHRLFTASFLFSQWPENHFYVWQRIANQALPTTPVLLGQVWSGTGSDPPFPEPGIWLVESLASFGLWTLHNWAVYFSLIEVPACNSGSLPCKDYFLELELLFLFVTEIINFIWYIAIVFIHLCLNLFGAVLRTLANSHGEIKSFSRTVAQKIPPSSSPFPLLVICFESANYEKWQSLTQSRERVGVGAWRGRRPKADGLFQARAPPLTDWTNDRCWLFFLMFCLTFFLT